MQRSSMGWAAGVLGLLCASCAGEGDDGGMKLGVEPSPTAPATGNTPPAMPAANSGAAGSAPSTVPASPVPAGMAGSAAPAMPVTPPPRPAGMGRAGAPSTMPPAPAMPMTPPATPPGPDDGDPSAPVVAIPNLACGPGRLLGTGAVNVMIGGRGVHVAYPCNKHKGAPVTFILNLHGTMPTEDIKLYQVGYFSAHNLVDSHNFITVAPKAIGSQWGNSDMGKDEPHLMEVIQWTYDTFKDFDIRAMWVGGHSWGAAYTARFGCKAELADKVKGLILMSGGGAASCQSKISQIITTAEGDGRMPPDQTTVATSHGCMAAKTEMILMNNYTSWPGCMKGYAHANYYMLGKEHATFMDAEVVKSIGDWIKAARL